MDIDFITRAYGRLYIKASADWQSFDYIQYQTEDSVKEVLAKLEENIANFITTTMTFDRVTLVIQDITDKATAFFKVSGIARVRKISTGRIYEVIFECYKAKDDYATLHSYITTLVNTALTDTPAIYAFDITDTSVTSNVEIPPE
jgi:hypothetical protein